MVQAAIAAGGTALLGAFSNQSRSRVDTNRPDFTSSLPALAAADKKQFRKLKSVADQERIYQLLMQPEVLGFLMAFGGLIAANRIRFSSDNEANMLLQGVASAMSVGMGSGYAGVGDLTSFALASMAGGATVVGQFNVWDFLGSIFGFGS